MYNKRVRIATDMFSELFGADFDAIIPIYPTQSVDALAHKWDSKAAQLERLQLALDEEAEAAAAAGEGVVGGSVGLAVAPGAAKGGGWSAGARRQRRMAKLKLRISALEGEVAALQVEIAAERDAVLSSLPSTCFFATFKSQQAAAVASQVGGGGGGGCGGGCGGGSHVVPGAHCTRIQALWLTLVIHAFPCPPSPLVAAAPCCCRPT